MRDTISELVGTFVFASVVLASAMDPVLMAAGLLAAVVFARHAGPAHLNPVVSTAMYLRQKISTSQYVSYIAAQMVGGIAAVAWTSFTA